MAGFTIYESPEVGTDGAVTLAACALNSEQYIVLSINTANKDIESLQYPSGERHADEPLMVQADIIDPEIELLWRRRGRRPVSGQGEDARRFGTPVSGRRLQDGFRDPFKARHPVPERLHVAVGGHDLPP